jgi:muramidase (phage lysozyme)
MSELKITGNPNPIVGKEELYSVNQLLPSPLPFQNLSNASINPFEETVDWSVHVLENGRWIKKEENNKRGNKVSYKFIQKSLERKGIRILAKRGEQTARLDIKPQKAESPKIDSIQFLDKNGNKPTKPFAYGQTLKARVHCLHMENRRVYATLWEDDAAGGGHDKANEKNKMKTLPGTVKGGIADIDFVLEPDFAKIADAIKSKGDTSEGKTHEYYVTAEILNTKTASKNTNVANPSYKDTTAKPATPKKQTPAQKKGPSKKQEKEKSVLDDVIDWWEGLIKIEPKIVPNPTPPTGNNPLKIGEVDKTPKEEQVKIEGIITAYFAKEEFTKETTDVDGQHQYTFANKNDNIDRNKIAGIIKKKVDVQVKANKKYAKLDDIKNALTSESYAKGATISFNLYKLGAEFKKINSAPLEEEVYVIAKTFLLDGKEVTITIKEKDAILVGSDTDLTFLEGKEGGSDITKLKATVENGIAKVKIKLRPKADEDLKKWKEKLLKGKKQEAYTYKFKSGNIITATNKKQFATIILNNAKEGKQGNTKIENGKTAFADDVEKALENKTYIGGDTITFDTYKTQVENLWLKAECQGDTKKHEGEYLKKDGEYFVIGKKCVCEERIRAFMRMLRIGEGTEKEKGYTTQYSGTQFTDMTKHPENVITAGNYSSSAAGAYQIMRYTWWWLGGEKLTDDNKKAGVYEEYHDYIKKYSIPDFTQESQDKLCVIILKHKRPGSLVLITNNQIKESLEQYGSYEWASLPPGRYGQPTQNMDVALAKYEEYLKDELTETTNLYIKKGFMKEFGIKCNCLTNNSNNEVTLHFDGITAVETALSAKTKNILKEVGKASGNYNIHITSTARTPHDQARIMYENCENTGANVQKGIYAASGDAVVDVYTAGKNADFSQEQIITNMENKINELGPEKVSKHLANPDILNTFDISYGKLTDKTKFLAEINKRSELDTVLVENNCYHVQINQ